MKVLWGALTGSCAALFVSGASLRAAENVSLDLGDGVKMEFVWVPVAGSDGRTSVQIGDQSGAHEKEPVRTETLWGPFQQAGKGFGYYLGKTEVTEAQWANVTGHGKTSQLPATGKTFPEIQSFSEALNAKSDQSATFPRTGDGSPGVIRLPTEAEWEYAARGGAGPDFAAADPYKGDVERHEVFSTPGGSGRAREVAAFPPNSLGLHDMLGNVREFVEGSYSIGGMVGGFLLKGGSYTLEKSEIRSSARTEQPRSGKDGKPARRPDAGFRVCISADVYTSLVQAEGVKGKLKSEKEKTEKSEALKAEAAKLDERLKQAEAASAKAKEESKRLTQDAAMSAKRKSLEIAENNANEEKARLEALKKQLASGTPPLGNATTAPKEPAPKVDGLQPDPALVQKINRLVTDSDRSYRMGDFETALKGINEAADLLPNDPGILLRRARLFESMQQPADAAADYARVAALPGLSPELRTQAERKLTQLGGSVSGNPTATPAANQVMDDAPARRGSDARDETGLPFGSFGIADARLRDGSPGTKVLSIATKARHGITVDAKKIKLHVFFYEKDEAGDIQLTESKVVSMWSSPPVDWKHDEQDILNDEREILDVIYILPDSTHPGSAASNGSPGRTFVGYIVGIYYNGLLLDTRADPGNLAKKFPLPLYLKQESQ